MYNTIKMSHIHWIIIVFYIKIVVLCCSRVMNVGYLGDVYWGSGCVWVGVGLDWVESGFMGDVGEGLGVLYFGAYFEYVGGVGVGVCVCVFCIVHY